MTARALERLTPGQLIPFGGDRVTEVDNALAERFRAGDRLIVVQDTGDLLHIPSDIAAVTAAAVDRAVQAFTDLAECSDSAIEAFFVDFAARLSAEDVRTQVLAANQADIESARARGRQIGRLQITETMWRSMVDGIEQWSTQSGPREIPHTVIEHDGWTVRADTAPLGVVGFVFEGRPNVFADAVGVVRTRNTVVMRIGSDALRTATAITALALEPSLVSAGLPTGSVVLVEAVEHAAGWALFSDQRLALAVARGSGQAVRQLGAVARQSGVPVSLHGTGGAWMLIGDGCEHHRLVASIRNSIDRKVCNTLNVVCIVRRALQAAAGALVEVCAELGDSAPVVHVVHSNVVELRAATSFVVDQSLVIETDQLGHEWEWEAKPEFSLVIVDELDDAVDLFNRWSPRFIASVLTGDVAARQRAFRRLDAPFIGDGFTRWVDGQYALGVPELGLSNWEGGRLLGRGAVLTGDTVHTVRLTATIDDPDVHR